jgi:putative superfamily III holin-X
MATRFEPNFEPRISTLVGGIAADGQELLAQQLELLKCEIREDLRTLKQAAIFLAIGCVLVLPAAVLLCLMLVHFLNWAWPALPLWACFGIVGGILAIGAATLLTVGAKYLTALHALENSADALKENWQWLRNLR